MWTATVTPEYAPLLWPNREVILRVRIDGPVGQGTTAVVDDLRHG